MPSQRRPSTITVSQPVRFYKFIAITFLLVTIALFGTILFMSAKRATITIITKSEPIEVSFSVNVASDSPVSGTVLNTTVRVDQSFRPEGTREAPGQATGEVTIYNTSGREQPLVATTRLLSADGVLFRLRRGVTVPAGGSVTAEVYADKEGELGNIGPFSFTIPGLNPARQQEIYAKSETAMSGGIRTVGEITREDIVRAEKIVFEAAKDRAAQEFKKQYPALSPLLSVASHNVVSSHNVGDDVDEFSVTGEVEVAGVLYNADELVAYAQTMLDKQVVEKSEVLQFVSREPAVTLAGFDTGKGTAALNVVASGRVTLDAESDALEKSVFFGKNEDDVRRYALSLDHVQGARVEFRPVWNRSVPHVAEHINIVVRQVE